MPPNQSTHPSERLIQLRHTLGLSQRDLAKEFQVSSGAIASWETGTRIIPGPVLRLIELYEKSLPSMEKKTPQRGTDTFLKELKTTLSLSNSEEDRQILETFQNGLAPYLDATDSVNSLNSKLKLMLVQRMLKSLKTSKGLTAKIAQLASFLEMGLPLEIRTALGTLQSRAEPAKPKAIQKIMEEEYGLPLMEVFPHWREEPLAVTSLSQVHYAKLPNGDEVAVKVQHPEIRDILQKQISKIELVQSLASFLGKNDNEIIAEIKRSLLQECDYFQEAQNQERFRNVVSDDPRAIVPRVYRDLVRERVFVSEFIRGESFQNFVSRANQSQRNTAAEIIMETLTKAAFGYCLTHTDLHPGNFLFANGKVAFLDFGRLIDCNATRMKVECQFYIAMLNRDYEKCKELALTVFAKDKKNFDFDAFWAFLLKSHAHLMTDDKFQFSRDYAQTITREGRAFSKKHQLQTNKETFWAFVFSVSTWGLLADLGADINLRRIALKTTRMAENL